MFFIEFTLAFAIHESEGFQDVRAILVALGSNLFNFSEEAQLMIKDLNEAEADLCVKLAYNITFAQNFETAMHNTSS